MNVRGHLFPLPPGAPYQEQQLEVLEIDRGILQIPEADMADLAKQIRDAMGE